MRRNLRPDPSKHIGRSTYVGAIRSISRETARPRFSRSPPSRSAPRKYPSPATAYHRRVVDGAAAADDSEQSSVAGRYLGSASARQPASANTHTPTVTAPSAHNRSPRNLQLEPEDTRAPTKKEEAVLARFELTPAAALDEAPAASPHSRFRWKHRRPAGGLEALLLLRQEGAVRRQCWCSSQAAAAVCLLARGALSSELARWRSTVGCRSASRKESRATTTGHRCCRSTYARVISESTARLRLPLTS